jgi:hypothetical protein
MEGLVKLPLTLIQMHLLLRLCEEHGDEAISYFYSEIAMLPSVDRNDNATRFFRLY